MLVGYLRLGNKQPSLRACTSDLARIVHLDREHLEEVLEMTVKVGHQSPTQLRIWLGCTQLKRFEVLKSQTELIGELFGRQATAQAHPAETNGACVDVHQLRVHPNGEKRQPLTAAPYRGKPGHDVAKMR